MTLKVILNLDTFFQTPLSALHSFPSLLKRGVGVIYNFSLNPLKASALFPLGTCPELVEGSKEGSLV